MTAVFFLFALLWLGGGVPFWAGALLIPLGVITLDMARDAGGSIGGRWLACYHHTMKGGRDGR